MLVKTNQFGTLEVDESELIHFPKGLLGFEVFERYAIVDNAENRPFRWLQSVDEPALAFIIVSPLVFFPHYRVAVHEKEVADIGVTDPHDVQICVIVTIPENFEEMSANLQGPVLINSRNRKAKQLVLTNSDYSVQHSIVEQIGSLESRAPMTSRSAVELTP